jgi:hypothetical protein
MTVRERVPPSETASSDRVNAVCLTEDELAYHSRMVERTHWARSMVAQVQEVEAAFNSWAEFLRERYDLKSGDRVAEDGTIIRAPQQQT